MKFTAEDFKDRLAGDMDKVAAVEAIKEKLAEENYSCKISRRQTATGRKIYFKIAPLFEADSEEYATPWWAMSELTIQEYFPNCRLISGSNSSWTIAEY